jgi:hypothetical protein
LDALEEICIPLSRDALSFVLKKGMLAALVLTSSSEVCSLCCGKQTPSWEIQAVKEDTASCVASAIF